MLRCKHPEPNQSGSDHRPIRAKIRLTLREERNKLFKRQQPRNFITPDRVYRIFCYMLSYSIYHRCNKVIEKCSMFNVQIYLLINLAKTAMVII
jgi:hypothetical protein